MRWKDDVEQCRTLKSKHKDESPKSKVWISTFPHIDIIDIPNLISDIEKQTSDIIVLLKTFKLLNFDICKSHLSHLSRGWTIVKSVANGRMDALQ